MKGVFAPMRKPEHCLREHPGYSAVTDVCPFMKRNVFGHFYCIFQGIRTDKKPSYQEIFSGCPLKEMEVQDGP